MARKSKSAEAPETKTAEVTETTGSTTAKSSESTVSENNAPATTPVAVAPKKLTPDEEMANLRKIVEDNCDIYNDAIKVRATPICNDAINSITEALKSYVKVSEKKTFKELSSYENVMLEAAKRLTFPIIKVDTEKKGNDKIEYLKVVDGFKRIDPLRLDDYCDGIGYDTKWKYMVERLNFCVTARRAIELGIDPTEINDSYAMKKESKKIDSFKTIVNLSDEQKKDLVNNKVCFFDYNTSNKVLTEDIQTVVTAMLGEGYTVDERSTAYLLAIYSKRSNKKSLNVVCSNHKFMRSYMLDICHSVCTDDKFSLTYKQKKADE